MKTRQLGNSGLPVTPIGLGLAALGRVGYINLGHGDDLSGSREVAALQRQAHHVLDAAWAAGVRYFDAARSYGKAEDFLASWLLSRDIAPDAVTVGSKWGYTYTANWQVSLPEGQPHEVKEHSLANLRKQRQESGALLGSHLDLYQIHSATLESGVLSNQPVLAELARLRNEGLAVGLSVSGVGQAETIWRALSIQFDGAPLFAAVQATWNLLERSAGEALQAAHHQGLGVIIKEALANGRLTDRNSDPAFLPGLALLRSLAEEQGVGVDALALAAVINQPFTSVALSGAARAAHLHSNVQALQVSWDDGMAASLEELQEPAARYWETRSRMAWN